MKYTILEKLTALREKLSARKAGTRLLALLLALVLLQGDFILPAYATESESSDTSVQTTTPETNVPSVQEQAELPVNEDTLVITLDGVETSVLELFEYEKMEIRAEGLEQQADYQWQILHPENGTWINIYDATEQSISVSAALVKNMLNEDGSAALRCRAYTEEYAYLTDSIHITLLEEPETASVQLFSLDDEAVPMAEGDTTPEFITVTIEYKLYGYKENDKGEYVEEYLNEAFTPYIATLKTGTTLSDPAVHCPTVIGYTPTLSKATVGNAERDPATDEFNATTQEVIIMDLTYIMADVVYTVEYHPANVPYEVHYYFQNIYDDLYTEDTSIHATVHTEGKTGTKPDVTYTEAVCTGFTSLYYEPEIIAADGSTVFNVYYERNYFLMEFDCNEGFGTDTIYVRYGTYISVPTPVRPGWNFAGWDLVDTDQIFDDPADKPNLGTDADGDGRMDGDGVSDMPLPTTMPPYNSAYKALWTTTETTYTVAYWIDNGDGTYTPIGSRIENANSNDKVSGSNDLTSSMNVCGLPEHNHATSGCYYACGKTVHSHNDGNCDYACGKTVHSHDDGNCEYDCGKVIHTHDENCCSLNEHSHDDGDCTCSDPLHVHGDGTCTYSCGYDYEHSHDDGNCEYGCGNDEHQHSGDCYTVSYGWNNTTPAKTEVTNSDTIAALNNSTAWGNGIVRRGNRGSYTYYIQLDGIWYLLSAQSGAISQNTSVTTTLVCVQAEHSHDENCCSLHVHDDSCCSNHHTEHNEDCCILLSHSHGTNCNTDLCLYGYEHLSHDGCSCILDPHVHDGTCGACVLNEHSHTEACYNCGLIDHTHGDSCKTDTSYLEYVGADGVADGAGTETVVIVEGDGSTVVNVYYKYKEYTLKFYYAKEENSKYYVAGGSTWAFSGDVNDLVTQFGALTSTVWGEVKTLPTITSSHITKYETGSDEYTVNGVPGKYYYLQFSAQYNSDISTIWPVGIFDPVETISTFDYGNYAYFSAWNVDANTVYDEENENKTLKGNYQRLDDKMLMAKGKTDRGTIHFLAFWENGADDIGWNAPHKWIYNVYIPSLNGTHTYNDIKYTLYGTYTLYDDNTKEGSNPPHHQTPTALEGYTYIGCESQFVEQYDTTYGLNVYQINFYYEAIDDYTLSFFNHNKTFREYANTAYATDLTQWITTATTDVKKAENYPDTLEPGAYYFAGWYTTAQCLPKSEFGQFYYDAEGIYTHSTYDGVTMPAGDLTLYAKWEPVKRNVYFHFLYSDIATGTYWYATDANGNQIPTSYPIVVDHGTLLGTTYAFTPTRVENGKEYTFVGWFYMDENGKKRFAPDTMEIRQDLHLFAEWQSGIDTQYEVTYVLKEDATVGDTLYPAGTVLADPSAGHLTAGKTKTFSAKAGTELRADFVNASLFPDTNSHSILMTDTPADNTFQFKYVMDEEVWYKIKYLDKSDNSVLHEEFIWYTNQAIITPKFEPIRGYIPDQYYIRKVLASDGATGSRDNVIPENEIIFYYTKDEDHGLFTILYYTKNLDGTWYQDQSELGSDDLFESDGVTPKMITRDIPTDKYQGFTYSHAEVTTYTYDSTTEEYIGSITKTTATEDVGGKLTAGGLEIRIYYERNYYPYVIKFIQYGTSTVLGYSQVNDAQLYTLEEINTEKPEAWFDSSITYDAPKTITQGNFTYLLVSDTPQSKKIRVETAMYEDLQYNQLTFYYAVKKTTVQYEARCTVAGAIDFGFVSPNSQNVATTDQLHAVATPLSGFEFVGWYNADTGDAVKSDWVTSDSSGYHLQPTAFDDHDNDGVVKYYALFKPTLSHLTINKSVTDANGQSLSCNDTFLFSVQGTGKHQYINLMVAITGNGKVIIDNLPVGDYEITELTGWSYQYSAEKSTIQTEVTTGGTEITFTNTYVGTDWLGGESAVADNNFN